MLDADQAPSLDAIEAAFRGAGQSDLFSDLMLGSIHDLLRSRFENEAVQAALGLIATFGTNSGPQTPGTAYVMAHHLFGGTRSSSAVVVLASPKMLGHLPKARLVVTISEVSS